MALHIKGDEIDELADRYRSMIRAPSKADAVREALRRSIALEENAITLSDRLAPLQDRIAELGPVDPKFDPKASSHRIWSDD